MRARTAWGEGFSIACYCKISYHINILIFNVYFNLARGILPFNVDWVVLMLVSYVVAIGYHKVLKKV